MSRKRPLFNRLFTVYTHLMQYLTVLRGGSGETLAFSIKTTVAIYFSEKICYIIIVILESEVLLVDYLIKNVKIVDGQGKDAYIGSVGISDGRIVLENLPEEADTVIDGSGRILAPGFIDAHSHGDMTLGTPLDYGDLCKINQGVTTHVAGQ